LKLKIYLIGQITKNTITYDWRRNIRLIANGYPPILKQNLEIIDPCSNYYSKKMLDQTISNNTSFSKAIIATKQASVFPAVDEGYVKYSNACICNANHYTPETVFVGTIFELAWYKKEPWKPVIGVFLGDPKEDYLCSHPFVWDTVHTWVKTPEEALTLLVTLHGK
jgi:hypothetical protein